ncbi:unnamed protein product [Durusdinium trenchii]|uniref:Uncharacterized protein n=1 Tax=Durusdinium trenchii TaxID=1381693 RepID=A0ABP0HFS1_9DINO
MGAQQEPFRLKVFKAPGQFLTDALRLVCLVFLRYCMVLLSLVFVINTSTGAFAVGSIGTQLQSSIGIGIETYMIGKMEPLRIYLQQGILMFEEFGWNLSQWSDLQKTLPYQRSFLETYFDESRCCSGIFTNLRYDDVLLCHAMENPDCTGTNTNSMDGELGSMDLGGDSIWAGVLQYSDTYTTGQYPGLDEDSFGHWVQPIGFVHWPIQDGYWYRDIRKYNLSKGEVRFATRVFPWTLYPPAVLKSHMFTPIYSPGGELIGGWVVGFKLHWITAYLQELKKPAGTFIFLVERKTGVLISTSEPEIRVLKNYHTNASYSDVIIATESPDPRVSERAKQLVQMAGASARDWSNVRNLFGRPEIKTTGLEPAEEFLLSRDFEFFGLDWVIVISIPGETVLADITANMFTRLFSILGATGGMKLASSVLLAILIALCGKCCYGAAQVADDGGESFGTIQPPDMEPDGILPDA